MGCCAGVLVLGGAPRLALFLLWLFTERLELAFDSFVIGLLGFIFLPYTAVLYALAYAPIEGVSGFGWFVVAFGFVLDITSYTSGGYANRRRQTA